MINNIKISSIIIAKNEEQNIKRCIDSQLNCVDDIVVIVDSLSTDATWEIVNSYDNITVEKSVWMGYSKSKVYALSKTKYDWVLWIDADEAITRNLSEEIIALKKEGFSGSAYKIARRAFFLGRWIKHSGWYPGYVTRLFNKNNIQFSDSKVHEHLIVEGPVQKLKYDLEHYTDPNIFHYFEKFNNYTTLAAKELSSQKRIFKTKDIVIRPLFIFIKMYILRRGFLDGIQGLMLALFSSAYVLTKYSKLWELEIREKS